MSQLTQDDVGSWLGWIFERVTGFDYDGTPVRVKMFGGVLDGQVFTTVLQPELSHDYEVEHPLLDEVVIRQRDVWIPSFFVPYAYCYYRTVRL